MSQEDLLKLILNRADSTIEKLNVLSERTASQEARLDNIEIVLKDGHLKFNEIQENCYKYRMATNLELNTLKSKSSQLNGKMKETTSLLKDADFWIRAGKMIAWIIGPTGALYIIYLISEMLLHKNG